MRDTHGRASVPRVKSHVFGWLPHLSLTVIVWAVLLATICRVVARVDLVIVRVVLLLFPAVAVETAVLQVTSIAVGLRLLLGAPEAALLPRGILVDVRASPEVLPVVRILALVTHMTAHLIIEGTPGRLEVEHVEVGIRLHLVEQINRQLLLRVSESTEVSEVTRFDTVRPLVTELGLILLGMVEGLHTVVGLGA